MGNKLYVSDLAEHFDLSFIGAAFHNELVVLHAGHIKGRHFNERRAFILSFTAMVEGTTYNLRQFLLRQHERGQIVLSLPEQLILSEREYRPDSSGHSNESDRIHPTQHLLKYTLKAFAKYHNKETELTDFLSKDGFRSCSETFTKRNSIVHPKKSEDVLVNDSEWQNADNAFSWFHDLQIALFEGNIFQEKTQ